MQDAADRLGLVDAEEAGPSKPTRIKGVPVVKKRKFNEVTEGEKLKLKEEKYVPKLLTGSQKMKIIKKKAKQRLHDLIEKEKAAKQNRANRIKVRK